MPTDFIICNCDMIQITLDPPTVAPLLAAPVPLVASGLSKVGEMAVCLKGDELPPSLRAPMPYTCPPYTVPGVGTVSVASAPTNTTQHAKDSDTPMLVKGGTFQATFTVSVPAQMPPPISAPDPVATKTGTAVFITANTIATAE